MTESSESEIESSFTPTEQLETLLYQFVTLAERLEEGRSISYKQNGDMALLIKKLTDQVQKLSASGVSVRQELVQAIKDILNDEGKAVLHLIKHESSDYLNKAALRLEKSCENVTQTLTGYEKNQGYSKWMMFAAGIIAGVVVGLTTIKFLMPAPTLPLTQDQLIDMQGGELMEQIWPKLSKTDQAHIKAAGAEIKRQNPGEFNQFLPP